MYSHRGTGQDAGSFSLAYILLPSLDSLSLLSSLSVSLSLFWFCFIGNRPHYVGRAGSEFTSCVLRLQASYTAFLSASIITKRKKQ